MEQVETWKPIIGLEHRYLVSSEGCVKKVTSGDLLDRIDRAGQPYVLLCIDFHYGDIKKEILLNKLVLITFTGIPPKGMNCKHADADKFNCRLSNLSWKRITDHALHSHARGEANHMAKLTRLQVGEIKLRIADGQTNQELAIAFGVQGQLINKIRRGITWKDS